MGQVRKLNELMVNGVENLPEGLALRPIFIMKTIRQEYVDGKFSLYLLAFRRKVNCYVD